MIAAAVLFNVLDGYPAEHGHEDSGNNYKLIRQNRYTRTRTRRKSAKQIKRAQEI